MTTTDVLFDQRVRWLYCLPCQRPFELDEDGRGSCDCGRSRGRAVEDEVEVRGPAKALTPLETVVHADGGEWAIIPEDVVVRRVIPPAA